ncbi:MAG: zinc-binding dehydrogenase [Promethearchaeota archaeon]
MKAVVFDGRNLTLKELSKPSPAANQVLIQVRAVGICGTDRAIAKGDLKTPVPLVLGHEFAGEVIAEKSDTDITWLKKRVTSEINTNSCGKCFFCDRNIPTQCPERKALGIHTNGVMADYIALDSSLLHEVPKSISFNEATFIEPLAAAYQTFETMPLETDDRLLVIFGMGKLGLLLLQVAKTKGLEIIAIDGSNKKLTLARQLGASHVVNRHRYDSVSQAILDIGKMADIVVDATGNPKVLNEIISSCRSRGKLHIKSTHGAPTTINLTEMVQREITLYTSRCGPFEKAIQGLKSQQIKVNDLITQIYPLEKALEAFESDGKNRDNIGTILINP